MREEELESVVQHMSVRAIGQLVDGADNLNVLLSALAYAAATRMVVGEVQFDEYWYGQISGQGPFFAIVVLKLAPSICSRAYQIGGTLNRLTWHLTIPTTNDAFGPGRLPTNACEYLANGAVQLDDLTEDEGAAFTHLTKVLESIGR